MVLATRTSLGKSETSSDKSRTNFKVICTRVFNVHRVFKRVISLWDLLSVEKENQHVQNKFWRKKKRRKKRKDENTTKKKSKEKKKYKRRRGKKTRRFDNQLQHTLLLLLHSKAQAFHHFSHVMRSIFNWITNAALLGWNSTFPWLFLRVVC